MSEITALRYSDWACGDVAESREALQHLERLDSAGYRLLYAIRGELSHVSPVIATAIELELLHTAVLQICSRGQSLPDEITLDQKVASNE